MPPKRRLPYNDTALQERRQHRRLDHIRSHRLGIHVVGPPWAQFIPPEYTAELQDNHATSQITVDGRPVEVMAYLDRNEPEDPWREEHQPQFRPATPGVQANWDDHQHQQARGHQLMAGVAYDVAQLHEENRQARDPERTENTGLQWRQLQNAPWPSPEGSQDPERTTNRGHQEV